MSGSVHWFRELRSTVLLALPIVGGHVGQILLNLMDNAMVGRVGTVPLAASAFGNALFGVVFVMSLGLLSAIAVRVSYAHGARRPGAAGEALRHGLLLAGLAGLAGGVFLHALSLVVEHEWILRSFGPPPEVAVAARPFVQLLGWSLVPGLLFIGTKQYYEALHRPWVPMVFVLGGVGLNFVLNWVLIYGHLGAPALGLAGAGWATLVSRVAIVAGLWIHLAVTPAFAAEKPARWLGAWSWAEVSALLRLGAPAAGQLFFESSLFTAVALLMGRLGTVSLAAHQVALGCAATTFMVPLGLSQALSVRLGHARGAQRPELLRAIGLGGIGAGGAIMIASALAFILAGPAIARLFTADPAVIAMSAQLLVVAGVFQIFDGGQVTAIGALRGLADVTAPTVITFLGYWAIALPASWVLGFTLGLGPVGVWYGLVIGLGLCAVMLLVRFLNKTRPGAEIG